MSEPEETAEHRPAMPIPTVIAEPVAEQIGTMIGPYRLIEQIGQGGFGLVFVAEQQKPVRRKVALKVIKPGMDTREVIARFEAERQALALMDHPNIARVFDAGATDSGRPYFVMEFVRGVPITDYCDQYRLTPRERLGLFVSVCQAVQHAHQKGIIHRDIKPSNVLVTLHDGKPVVKVIDFGIAKALYQPLTEQAIYTRVAQIIGTPLYMSPEQAEMSSLDIDTRSDIYSLGVLLYELLTGSTPFDQKRFAKAAHDEFLKIIREEEPPKPSTRLSQSTESLPAIAAQRKTEPARLSKMIRGDLDWITMKALEKDRTRRYESASGFAADVLCYLHDEPVEASPPSAAYRLKKLARRHRAALVTTAAFACLLVAGTIVSTWLAIREKAARVAADTNAALAAQSAERANAEAENAQKSQAIAEQQRIEADAQRRVADAQRKRAEGYYEKSLSVVDRLLTRVGQDRLAKVPGFEAERRKILEDALEFYKGFLQEKDHPDPRVRRETGRAYNRIGVLSQLLGRTDEAETAFKATVDLERGDADAAARSDVASTLNNLGRLQLQLRHLDAAAAAFDEAVAGWEKLAREHPDNPEYRSKIAQTCHNLCILHRSAGRLDRADEFSQKALKTQEALVHDFPKVAEYRYVLAGVWQSHGNADYVAGRLEQAADAYRKTVTALEPFVKEHPDSMEYRGFMAGTLDNLGVVLMRTNHTDEAEAAMDKGRQQYEAMAHESPKIPQYRFDLAMCWDNLGNVRSDLNRTADAEAAYRKAVDLLEQLAAEHSGELRYRSQLRSTYGNLGNLYRNWDRPSQAEDVYRKALSLAESLDRQSPKVPEFQAGLATAHQLLGLLYSRTGRRDRAEGELRSALSQAESLAAANPKSDEYQSLIVLIHSELGEIDLANGHPVPAEAQMRKALTLQEALAKAHPENTEHAVDIAGILGDLGMVKSRAGKSQEALDLYARASSILEGVLHANANYGVARKSQAEIHARRANALGRLKRNAEALQELDRSLALATGKARDEYRADRACTLMHLGRSADALRDAAELEASPSLGGTALCRLADVHALAASGKNDQQTARALELLSKAKAAGYFTDPTNVTAVKEDEDLGDVRSRPEFRSLIEGGNR
jgi:eukaryotic-like serine/threonine-protein kinase